MPGHDHSGGTFGVPIVGPIWSMMLGMDYDFASAAMVGGFAPRMDTVAGDVAGAKRYIWSGDIKTIWVPGCASDGCYVDAQLMIVTLSGGATTLHLKWESGGQKIEDATRTIAAAGSDIWQVTERVRLFPGRLQVANFQLWQEAAGGVGGYKVSLLNVSINQTKTSP